MLAVMLKTRSLLRDKNDVLEGAGTRRFLSVLLPFGMLAGCAGYALDYTTPKISIVAPELARYGLSAEQAQCVGTRLATNLSVWQIRQLKDVAAAGIRQDQGRLTPQDLVWIASRVRDSKVTLEVARATGACAIASPVAPARKTPDPVYVREPESSAAAPAESGDTAETVGSPKVQSGPVDYQPSADLIAALEAYERADYALAARLAGEAASAGDSGANQFLGGLYAAGAGVPIDFAAAARHYAIAAEQGWSEAMNNLGKAYEIGQGVALDRVEALKWYLLASIRTTDDEQIVQRNMQQIVRDMTVVEIEQAATRADEWNSSRSR